jgi:hypothetical protein
VFERSVEPAGRLAAWRRITSSRPKSSGSSACPAMDRAAMECTGSVAAQALLVVAPGGQVGEVVMGQGVICVPGGRGGRRGTGCSPE